MLADTGPHVRRVEPGRDRGPPGRAGRPLSDGPSRSPQPGLLPRPSRPRGGHGRPAPALREARRLGDRGLHPEHPRQHRRRVVPVRSVARSRCPSSRRPWRWTYEGVQRTWLVAETTIHRALLGMPVEEELAEMDEALRTLADPAIQGLLAHRPRDRSLGRRRRGSGPGREPRDDRGGRGPVASSPTPWPAGTRSWRGTWPRPGRTATSLPPCRPHGGNGARLRELEGGIAALEGRPAEALELFGQAIPVYEGLGLALDIAIAGLVMVTGDGPVRATRPSGRPRGPRAVHDHRREAVRGARRRGHGAKRASRDREDGGAAHPLTARVGAGARVAGP